MTPFDALLDHPLPRFGGLPSDLTRRETRALGGPQSQFRPAALCSLQELPPECVPGMDSSP